MALVTESYTTLQEARQRVLDIIDERATGKFTEAKIDGMINECARRIWAKLDNVERDVAATATVGVSRYALPDILRYNGAVRNTRAFWNGIELSLTTYEPVDETSSGTPSSYAINGSDVVVYPVPDSSGELRLIGALEYQAPSNGTDTYPFGDQVLDVCILYAAYMMKLMDDEYQAAGMLRTAYEDAFLAATTAEAGVYEF